MSGIRQTGETEDGWTCVADLPARVTSAAVLVVGFGILGGVALTALLT